MSDLPAPIIKPREYTREEMERMRDITAAEEFLKRFYPELQERVTEEDVIQFLTIGHLLFKTNPEYLEVTTQRQRLPKQ